MPCLFALVVLSCPRLVLFVLYAVGYFEHARPWASCWAPLLGFVFAPVSTIVYGCCYVSHGGFFEGRWLLAIIAAAFFDFLNLGSARPRDSRP